MNIDKSFDSTNFNMLTGIMDENYKLYILNQISHLNIVVIKWALTGYSMY